jgi:hypothetical protein
LEADCRQARDESVKTVAEDGPGLPVDLLKSLGEAPHVEQARSLLAFFNKTTFFPATSLAV